MKLLKSIITLGITISMLNACSSGGDDPQPANCDNPPTVEVKTTDTSDCTSTDGTITATGIGGQGELSYSIDGINFQSEGNFNNLAAKSYTISVKDENNCTSSIEAIVSSGGTDLAFEATPTRDSDCLSDNGEIEITASGGVAPYQYNIGNGFSANAIFKGLSPGNYSVEVKDAAGCSVSKSVTVIKGNTGVSFAGQIKAIIETKCAISGCHNGSLGPDRDWRVLANLQANAAQVKSRTQSGDMPRTGSLTQDEIDLIACWVDDGAKNN